jgi:hypothetical protein
MEDFRCGGCGVVHRHQAVRVEALAPTHLAAVSQDLGLGCAHRPQRRPP